ncbi:MAG: hypothetical protein CVU56_26945 [Deltaproteobacteria bacterium HGW-Deltaproteobacteria-14]|nr:MAG: hypothetical protein CVU56_26945 [Deltaproteobacteria bacterium HGW-Deltaproteobacteria-14]
MGPERRHTRRRSKARRGASQRATSEPRDLGASVSGSRPRAPLSTRCVWCVVLLAPRGWYGEA